MKRTLRALCLLLALTFAAPSASTAVADVFDVEPTHAAVSFGIKHLGVSFVRGRFEEVAGEFSFDAKKLSESWIKVSVSVASVDTGNDARDKHLRAADIFDAAKHPKMTFESNKVETTERPDVFRVHGTLTLMGVAKPIVVEAQKVGEREDPWGGYRVGFTVAFTIKRSDHGMMFGIADGALSDEVDVIFDLEGLRRAAPSK